MHTKNLENSSKIECFMGQNAIVRTSMATTVCSCDIFQRLRQALNIAKILAC